MEQLIDLIAGIIKLNNKIFNYNRRYQLNKMANSQYSMSSQGSNVDSYINFDDGAMGQDDNVEGK
jgi:hypothetical protein